MTCTLRGATPCAALLLLLLLPGCAGETKPGYRQDLDVSQHLPQSAGAAWVAQPPGRTQVTVGPDAVPVAVEWIPAHKGPHRGISRISVVFPAHRESETFHATVERPVNRGTTDAVLESLTLHVQWTRNTMLRSQLATVSVQLMGDGTSAHL